MIIPLVSLFLQYFYNAHSQQYMYWDGTQYVPAPNQAPLPANVGIPNPEDRKEDKTVKKEKGKVAKKVSSLQSSTIFSTTRN